MSYEKLRLLEGLTDKNDYDTKATQSDVIEELIQVETDEIVVNESASQPEKTNQMLENKQNEDVNQTKVQIEHSPQTLRKIKYMHCKNYIS